MKKISIFTIILLTYFLTYFPSYFPSYSINILAAPLKQNASIDLYGEKTDVELGESIRLRLSAVNYITNPVMHVQTIIIPPSGMSVTSTEFVKSPIGQYTSDFELQPGEGKDIEVDIISNQIGNFNITGKIIYYFGGDKSTGEYQDLNLPIRVRYVSRENSENISKKTEPDLDSIAKILNIISEIIKTMSEIIKTISNNGKNDNLERNMHDMRN